MRLSAIDMYASRANFKGGLDSIPKNLSKLGAITPPKLSMPQDIFSIPWEKRNAMIQEYINKLYETYFDASGKLNPEIEKFLDETPFEIEYKTPSGYEKVVSTIKDYIRSSISSPEDALNEVLFHGTHSQKAFDGIMTEGFNPRYISRSKLGPGFYFTPSQADAMEYGNVVKAKFSGKIAHAKDRFFENVTHYRVSSKVGEFLGLNSNICPDITVQHDFPSKIIKEYSRNFITNDLKIDALYGYGGDTIRDYCICVLNPKALSEITKAK